MTRWNTFQVVSSICLLCMVGCTSSQIIARSTLIDGHRFHFTDYSSHGPQDVAIVLIHGWSCDQSAWAKQVENFATRARVITIDLPGHGKSDKPDVEYSMAFFARSIANVMDSAGIQSAILVGHSNGTPVAREFYRMYPERTAGIVVVDGALRSFFTDPAVRQKFIERMSGENRNDFLIPFVENLLPKSLDDESKNRLRTTMLNTPEHVQVSSFRATFKPEIWEPDPIHVPFLVILADAPFWTDEYESFVRKLAPHVDYHKMKGVSHFLMMDKPEEFNRLVLSWIQKNNLLN